MASSNEDDSQTYFILGLAVGIIALVILLVVGVAINSIRGGDSHAERAAPSPTTVSMMSTQPVQGAGAPSAVVTESVVVVIPEGASIRVDDGVVKFYFASGSADLAPGAAEALAAVIQGVGAGKKAQISGFHDATGDAAINDELAKRRAETIREVLVGLGVPPAQVVMKKPEGTTGTGNNAQARRVEVKLVD